MSIPMDLIPITPENIDKIAEHLRKTQEFDWQYLKTHDVTAFDNSIIRKLKSHSPMLYTNGRQRESVATAIYVSYQGINYLLTAGHVFDKSLCCKDIYIEPGFRLSEIKNGIIYYPKDEKNNFREMDCAVFLVNDVVKSKLDEQFEPFPISVENKGIARIFTWYFLLGYPVKKNTANRYKAGSLEGKYLCLHAPVKFDACDIKSFDADVNIALSYQPKKAILTEKIKENQQHTVCDLSGMSGCGIWNVPEYPIMTTGMTTSSYSLEGLFANHYPEGHALIGFNIHDIIGLIEYTTEQFYQDGKSGILKSLTLPPTPSGSVIGHSESVQTRSECPRFRPISNCKTTD